MQKLNFLIRSLIKHKTLPLSYLQVNDVCKATAAKFYLLRALIKHKTLPLSYLQVNDVCKATAAKFYLLRALIKHKTLPLSYLQVNDVCKATAAKFYLLRAPKKHLSVLLFLILAFSLIPCAGAEEETAEAEDNTLYYELSPPFVVNLNTEQRRMRFLQVRLQVLGSPEAIAEVQTHNAPLRDVIISLLSAQTRESVNTPKKKKKLQLEIQGEVEKVLENLTGNKQIEGLYFTSFIIQ